MKIAKNMAELVGNTPMLEIVNYNKMNDLKAKLVVKLEMFNPMGSAKDRVALNMIENALERGDINKDTVIIEPTSGNTGIGLAWVTAIKGMKLILTMPETMSIERQKLVKAFGAQVVLTPGSKGMSGAIEEAKRLAIEYGNAFIPQQFENSDNAQAHRLTTGKEILADTEGNVDIFVAGVGTGGTITGVGETLKEYNKNIRIVAVEPDTSAVLSGKPAGAHGIQGIGAGFIPKVLNKNIIDEIVTVSTENAYETSRQLAKTEGALVGISSGAALYAATQLAKREENAGKTIVVLLTDTGERYLSTTLF